MIAFRRGVSRVMIMRITVGGCRMNVRLLFVQTKHNLSRGKHRRGCSGVNFSGSDGSATNGSGSSCSAVNVRGNGCSAVNVRGHTGSAVHVRGSSSSALNLSGKPTVQCPMNVSGNTVQCRARK